MAIAWSLTIPAATRRFHPRRRPPARWIVYQWGQPPALPRRYAESCTASRSSSTSTLPSFHATWILLAQAWFKLARDQPQGGRDDRQERVAQRAGGACRRRNSCRLSRGVGRPRQGGPWQYGRTGALLLSGPALASGGQVFLTCSLPTARHLPATSVCRLLAICWSTDVLITPGGKRAIGCYGSCLL